MNRRAPLGRKCPLGRPSPTEYRTMLAQVPSGGDLVNWPTLVTLVVGILVAALVITVVRLLGRWRRKRLGWAAVEGDLSWDDLLDLVRRRSHQRKQAGLAPDEEVPGDDLLEVL